MVRDNLRERVRGGQIVRVARINSGDKIGAARQGGNADADGLPGGKCFGVKCKTVGEKLHVPPALAGVTAAVKFKLSL